MQVQQVMGEVLELLVMQVLLETVVELVEVVLIMQ
jgi:hypothetical protein